MARREFDEKGLGIELFPLSVLNVSVRCRIEHQRFRPVEGDVPPLTMLYCRHRYVAMDSAGSSVLRTPSS